MKRGLTGFNIAALVVGFGFLYLPIVIMGLMSFNASPFYMLPIEWSTTWYVQLAGNAQLVDASLYSLKIALATALIATTLGTAASLALFRYEFRGKKVLQALLLPPIVDCAVQPVYVQMYFWPLLQML